MADGGSAALLTMAGPVARPQLPQPGRILTFPPVCHW